MVVALAGAVALPAQAGVIDRLFGESTATPAAPGQRLWPLHEFSRVERVPREAGAAPNQQPAEVAIEALRQQLLLIETVVRGVRVPLFTPDEVGELVTPLVQALHIAGPDDDLLVLSSDRREGGILGSPKAVTARVFVSNGALNVIVHDARMEFYDQYRGTYVKPTFVYGSRSAASSATIQSAKAVSKRADWLSIPLTVAGSQETPTTSTTAPPMAPGAAPVGVPAPAPAAAPRKPLDAAGAEDIERRLETLKRLRDKNLITEEEYVQKRREILQAL